MTDSQKLDLILSEIQGMKNDAQGTKNDIQGLKNDMQGMKDDMQSMKDDMQNMKDDMQSMKDDMQSMKDDMRGMNDRLTGIELHLENVTDWNIRLLAENHMTLIDKLNDSIKAADKSALYEIQVRILTEKVDKLSKDVDKLKNKTA